MSPVLATSGDGTSSTLLVGAVVAVFCGAFCAVLSVRSRRRTGRALWRMPPWLWFLIGLVGGVLGLLLGLVAMFTAPPAPTPDPVAMATPPARADWTPPVAEQGPAGAPSLESGTGGAEAAPTPDFAARLDFPAPEGPPPAYDRGRYENVASGNGAVPERRSAWLPDPKAPTRYRFYDGARWTEWVCSRHAGISVNHL